jgi:hypothetical protein
VNQLEQAVWAAAFAVGVRDELDKSGRLPVRLRSTGEEIASAAKAQADAAVSYLRMVPT